MSQATRRTSWNCVGLLLAIVSLGCGAHPEPTSSVGSQTEKTRPPSSFPLTPISSSPFLNTRPDAQYVGSAKCERCHQESHRSYHETMMSRSMAEVDIATAPVDSDFLHERSGRRYQTYRQGNELRQRESLTGIEGSDDVILADFPLKYVVGSGHFSRTYLAEIDGFMVEAPATWFAAKQGWDMSPGYDRPLHDGFERAMTENCMYCHAGRIESLEGTVHKFKVHEAAIGCERCHGPGSLHIERWEAHVPADQLPNESAKKSIDRTIVNPTHLSRHLADAICQQCHLTSDAQVTARGRRLSEFRPGLPLEDFFMSYQAIDSDESMKVVGHFDQMVQSRCYRESKTLTCLTCHNPHNTPSRDEQVEYFRSVCLDCHQTKACRVNSKTRAEKSPRNDCVQCHMPAAPTDIVHFAFTHHRIGVHNEEPTQRQKLRSPVKQLKPWHDLSRLSEIDSRRSLGLAYFDHAGDGGPDSKYCFQQSARLLEDVYERGLREGNLTSALSQMLSESQRSKAASYASEALGDPNILAVSKVQALYVLAVDHLQNGRPKQAIESVTELTRMRRTAADWALMGYCEQSLDHTDAAIAAFEKSIGINPKLLPIHRELVRLYQAHKDFDKAARQRQIGERLINVARTSKSAK